MKRKTISLDLDVYKLLRAHKQPRESLSAALRRLMVGDKDPVEYLDELMAAPVEVDVELLRRRQANPPRSSRRTRAG
jgi:predicted CopG family antitoxin